MKYLLLAVVIGVPALAVADSAPVPPQQALGAQLERLYRCQWLTAANAAEQQQQQDKADEDKEPDCD